MVDPVERICVAMLRRQDIEETLTAVDYLWHGYKLSTELVERDGRIYWSAKYLEDREDRELMDVTDLGLHRIAFHDQVLFNEVTAADVSGGRLHLEGRLLNQLGRIAPGDNVSLTITVRNKGQAHERTFPATVLGNDGSHLRWRVDIDLLRATRPLDQRLRVWDVRAGVSWNGVSNVGELTLAPTTLLPALISMRAGMRGVVRGGSLRPIVTSKGSLSFEQAPDRGAAARIGAVHALLQRANRSLRRRAGAAISHPGAKRRAYRLFQRLPVKPGLTVFESHLGKQYSDNPKYIYEATRRVGLDRLGIDPVWSYATVATGFPPEAGRVLRNSWRYYYLLARAQYWVDNQGFPRVFTKRPETTYLQTWHGTPLKRMGWDGPLATLSTAKQRAQERMVARWDHLVVPSEYFVDTFVRAFRYDGKLLRTGYPRNDLLVNRAADGDYVTDAKRRMGLPLDRTIVLYAATFRDRERGRDVTLPFDVSQLSVALHDDVFLLVRTHYLDRFTLGAGQAPFARSVSDYDDVTEVLLVADVLVTDYSSIMFDFANTGRPMVFYTHDYDDYVHRQRGTYFTLADEAPGPLVTTTEELARCLADIDAVRHVYADRYATWRQRFCEYDRGHAADDVVAQVFGSGDHV